MEGHLRLGLDDEGVGVPAPIRSDQGPKSIAKAMKRRIGAVGARIAYIERGSPSGYFESFNGRLRNELLGEIFTMLRVAQVVIEE